MIYCAFLFFVINIILSVIVNQLMIFDFFDFVSSAYMGFVYIFVISLSALESARLFARSNQRAINLFEGIIFCAFVYVMSIAFRKLFFYLALASFPYANQMNPVFVNYVRQIALIANNNSYNSLEAQYGLIFVLAVPSVLFILGTFLFKPKQKEIYRA